MSTRRPCPLCAHRAVLLSGRCTQPSGYAICGCTCLPGLRRGAPREVPMSAEAIRVLHAVEQGHLWGMGVIAATGLSMTAVYAILKRHRRDGLLERQAGRGSRRDRYRLTDRGRLLLASVETV